MINAQRMRPMTDRVPHFKVGDVVFSYGPGLHVVTKVTPRKGDEALLTLRCILNGYGDDGKNRVTQVDAGWCWYRHEILRPFENATA